MSDNEKKQEQPVVVPAIILILAIGAMAWFLVSLIGHEDDAALAARLAATPTDAVDECARLSMTTWLPAST